MIGGQQTRRLFTGEVCWMVVQMLITGMVTSGAMMYSSVTQAAGHAESPMVRMSEMPGEFVSLDGFRLRVDCRGQGEVTVLFEPGLGGSAFEWQPLQDRLMSRAQVCVYDRAGYGWSTRSSYPRTARYLAMEADQMLTMLGISGPLVVVGHSFGGYIMRLLALQRGKQIRGMVLIDSSHELQFERLEALSGKSMLPSGNHFVISPADIPVGLPPAVQDEIRRFSRLRKTYAALHAELSSFRDSAEQVRRSRVEVPYPVIVIRRGKPLYAHELKGDLKNAIWQELQEDLATLSPQGRVIVAEQSGHHVHADQPDLVIDALLSLLEITPSNRRAAQ